jgi:hypothetical protein
MSAQGSSEARTLGNVKQNDLEPCKGSAVGEPFQGCFVFFLLTPGLSLRSNRWAEISERLRRY